MLEHWKIILAPKNVVLGFFSPSSSSCILVPSFFIIIAFFLPYYCFIKSRAYFRFHGEIWWSQEQKEKTQTVFISEIILHSLKYALAVDSGMISDAQCTV